MKKLHLISLGCTKNLIDSEVMLGKLKHYEISQEPSDSDVIIINTCGFIEEAKKESIDTILAAHDERKKDSLLVVTGCLSQRYREELQELLPEVDLFTGVGDYNKIDQLINEKTNQFSSDTYLIDYTDERVVTGSNYHAFVKISEGCNQQCSFCAIPSFKGKLKSRSLESISKEVEGLVKKGYYDFTFISQDSSSFGRDLGTKKDGLIGLIKAIEAIDGVKSARILYLYPTTMTYELIDTIIESSVFESYFDIPLQHIDDAMLTTMRRGSKSETIKKMLAYIKEKDSKAFLRSGFIVGHPEESEEAFASLCEFIAQSDFERISVFRYSDEEGTKAYGMQNKVDEETIEKRMDIISKIVEDKLNSSFDNELGQECFVDVNGVSEEHEFFFSAKKSNWAFEIDGEILINDKEFEGDIEHSKRYKALIKEKYDKTLVATLVEQLH